MREFRFAHIADAHIGAWPKDPGLRNALRKSVLKALELVLEEECEFLLVSGDLFHTPVPNPTEAAPVAGMLKRLSEARIRTYAIFGSHDYVLHQTSWLDVLAEGGLFIRVAPSLVRSEESRWVLPCLTDERTGAVIAGVSGRAQGLDRKLYETMDSSEFTGKAGLKVFMFHAGINEYLPRDLSGRVEGVPLDRLPPNCDYYAGGHIHATYGGPGPGGHGTLVNPGATFGTSVTDLENVSNGITHAGIVIVDVKDGVLRPRWMESTAKGSVTVVDVDVEGCGVSEAVSRFRERLPTEQPGGAILIPRLHGMRGGSLDLNALSAELARSGATAVHLDTQGLSSREEAPRESPAVTAEDMEAETLRMRLVNSGAGQRFSGQEGVQLARELLRQLGRTKDDGESSADYTRKLVKAALGMLSPPAVPGVEG